MSATDSASGTAPLAPWPHYDSEQCEAVAAVLRSGRVNYWTGDEGRQFEREYAAYAGVEHAICVANGTVALELALVALDIGPGDEVVVPARSFIATASCVVARGATPVFADIDPVSHNVSAQTLAATLSPRTRALIVAHLSGWPCPMPAIVALASRHGLAVIEDCAQAHGASIAGKAVGSFGDLAAFSFCQDKIMSTGGEGGMLLCRDREHWERAWSYKDHGKHPASVAAAPGPAYRWTHEAHGTNWRMTECQAAIGRVQLRSLDGWVGARQANAGRLRSVLAGVPGLELPAPPPEVGHAYYRFAMGLPVGADRDFLLGELQRRGVPASAGVCPELYREKALARFAPAARLPVARRVGRSCMFLPVHPTLGNVQIDWMADTVRNVLNARR